jgi:hypothetical protein
MFYARSFASIFILVRLLFMLLFPSTLVYSLVLVLYVSFLVVYMVINSSVSGLLGLLILLVYVGAMIIIIRYICAVSPNMKYSYSVSVILVTFITVLLIFLSLLLPRLGSTPNPDFLTPSFLFTDLGLWLVSILCLFIVIILMYSTYTSPIVSSLRSTSVK